MALPAPSLQFLHFYGKISTTGFLGLGFPFPGADFPPIIMGMKVIVENEQSKGEPPPQSTHGPQRLPPVHLRPLLASPPPAVPMVAASEFHHLHHAFGAERF